VSAQTNPAAVLTYAPEMRAEPVRVAVLCDFREENWPSMDLVGNMLFDRLSHHEQVSAKRFRPALKFRGEQPGKSARFWGRFVQYPRLLRGVASDFDLFHIVDHSYAHLVHQLPAERTVVTCHDLDTFRCLLAPADEKRSFAFRSMTRRILTGLQSAAHVTCDTAATRDAILQHGLLPPERLTVVHNGVHPSFSPLPDPAADNELTRKLGRQPDRCPELLHVGSTISRKRIDVLLHVFAEIRRRQPDARLVRVGSAFTHQQEALAAELDVREHIDFLEHVDTPLLGACYRRASVLLQPSDAEGFGLPVIEAMACGTQVIASDIAPLREVGGNAAVYCTVADIQSWSNAVRKALAADASARTVASSRALKQASRFTWTNYANSMFDIYQQVLSA
jgi:glycosyltransferase involved in cell wall biosynthesis